jgi:L-asparaginase
MEYKASSSKKKMTPRLIIHGGAGNITPSNLPPLQYKKFHSALLSILADTHQYLLSGHDALDTVSFAVTKLENNPLFNSGHGAVFTRDGINEYDLKPILFIIIHLNNSGTSANSNSQT